MFINCYTFYLCYSFTNVIIVLLQIKMLYPEEGTVYNYNLDDAGISSSDSDDALDDDEKGEKKVNTFCT